MNEGKKEHNFGSGKIKITLLEYDLVIFIALAILLFGVYKGGGPNGIANILIQNVIGALAIFGIRFATRIYSQIWRYGGIQCYIRLLASDALGSAIYLLLELMLPASRMAFTKLAAFCALNLLCSLTIRMLYRFAYKYGYLDTKFGKLLRRVLKIFSFGQVSTEADSYEQKVNIAIIGAGSVGVELAENFWSNPQARYIPRYFIDVDPDKTGRIIHGIRVLMENDATLQILKEQDVQDIVLAIPTLPQEKKLEIYSRYKQAGMNVKVFKSPVPNGNDSEGKLHEFKIEDLLMREPKNFLDEKTSAYYRGKTVLITGGGGSIGSELCRQLARMNPKRLLIVDIYENGAYDLQQELQFQYHGKLDVRVEIVSITNKEGLKRIFEEYHPDICINAAAHKHVPFMEKNCIEAVQNNVFGALNIIRLCEEYACSRFIMVSTDKAVNPTNIMGATKRVCEMIMQAYSTRGKVVCSATRFGNVLGSAGSVVPLFERQIAKGGPVTVTDQRITRYFMTIPEASQLVLVSGALASNGELFVLDMGKPIRIYDLARSMVLLSGEKNIEIIETGLRPGEKLYEELLVQKDKLQKTDNDLIFIEKEKPISMEKLEEKLSLLEKACSSNEEIRRVMPIVVPTYQQPDVVTSN